MTGFQGVGFVSTLQPDHRDRLLDLAVDDEFDRGNVVIAAGKPLRALHLVSEGVVEARQPQTGAPIARIGPGSLVGELSFVLGGSATADVVAIERTMSLRVDVDQLTAALSADPEFAADVWRGLAKALAERVATTTGAWSRAARANDADNDVIVPADLRVALDDLAALLTRVEQEGHDPADADIDRVFRRVAGELTRVLDEEATVGEIFDRVRPGFIDVLVLSDYGRRVWEKPNGYAGDWETIEMMYRNEPSGIGRTGQIVDGALLRFDTVKATRNRRGLLADQIARAGTPGETRIASLACGPAREIVDVVTASPGHLAQINLLDIDPTALDNARRVMADLGLTERTQFLRSNLIKLALGREQLQLDDQDLVYSIGLIDYLPDELVVALLNAVHPWLRPGGRVILGNFHPKSHWRGLMELVEWSLIHRTEGDMDRLFEASAFGSPTEEILWEEEGINLFAVGIKR